jgi:hypothetical protein
MAGREFASRLRVGLEQKGVGLPAGTMKVVVIFGGCRPSCGSAGRVEPRRHR